MFCSECGSELRSGMKFCSNCGNKMFNENNMDANFQESMENKVEIVEVKHVVATNGVIEKLKSKEYNKVVTTHAFGAAGGAMASGWMPGLGGAAALIVANGFIFSMYFKLSNLLGIKWSKNAIKILSSYVASSIGSVAVVSIVGATALTFIPGLGSVSSSVIVGGLNYGAVQVAALIYTSMIMKLAKSGKDISAMSEEELKQIAQEIISKDQIKLSLDKAKDDFKKKYKSGEFEKSEKASSIEE